MALRCYFDGSEGFNERRILTLAAITATEDTWVDIQVKWEEMLRSRYPVAPYLHMSQMLAAGDPFERVNGWTAERQDDLVWDALKLLNAADKQAMRVFRCSIDLDAHARVLECGIAIPEPACFCVMVCVLSLMRYASSSQGNLPQVELFFDRGEGFIDIIKSLWIDNRTDPGRPPNPENEWDCILNIIEVDMKRTPQIQMADLAAWAATRQFQHPVKRWSGLSQLCESLIPNGRVFIDEASIRGAYGNRVERLR